MHNFSITEQHLIILEGGVSAINFDIFISYSSKNRDYANSLCDELEKQNVNCWIDHRTLLPGQSWRAGIVDALSKNEQIVMVLLFSSATQESEQVLKELDFADYHKILVIPIKIENIEFEGEYRLELGRRQWINGFDSNRTVEVIAQSIKMRLDHHKGPQSQTALSRPNSAAQTTASTSVTNAGEAKYLNALRIAYSDHNVTSLERDKLNSLAMAECLAPARIRELEDQVRIEMGVSAGKLAPIATNIDETFKWPDIGYKYLRQVLANLDRSRLPFEPIDVRIARL